MKIRFIKIERTKFGMFDYPSRKLKAWKIFNTRKRKTRILIKIFRKALGCIEVTYTTKEISIFGIDNFECIVQLSKLHDIKCSNGFQN